MFGSNFGAFASAFTRFNEERLKICIANKGILYHFRKLCKFHLLPVFGEFNSLRFVFPTQNNVLIVLVLCKTSHQTRLADKSRVSSRANSKNSEISNCTIMIFCFSF